MDIEGQRRSTNVQQGNTRLDYEVERRNAILRRWYNQMFPEKNEMADSLETFAKQQERARLENAAAALRERARMVSTEGKVPMVDTPGRFRSDNVVGKQIPRDMELQLLAAEALRQARGAP